LTGSADRVKKQGTSPHYNVFPLTSISLNTFRA
jgi:hypothetical protein